MKGTISYAAFERKLRSPFVYGAHSVDSRCGFILRLQSQKGLCYSEASPLPSHSRETLSDVASSLQGGKAGTSPSLRFALESLGAECGKEFPVRSNALLTWSGFEHALWELDRFRKLGYSHCKLKLGSQTQEEVANLIDENSSFLFRLDANRSLSPSALGSLLQLLDQRSLLDRIDYIEEPFEGIWVDKNFKEAPVAFAADESITSCDVINTLLAKANPPRVFVLKPTVHGGADTIASLMDFLKSKNARSVITSAIETEVGRRCLISLLSKYPHEVAGLSTGYLFQENYLNDQASWLELPAISPGEQAWLDSLDWKESQW